MSDTKQQHTAEPWISVPQSDGSSMIAREYETGKQMNPKGLRLIAHVMARGNSLAEDEANARRIVACVNELAGVQEVTGYVHVIEEQRDTAWSELREIRAAIAANSEEATVDEVRRVVAQRDEIMHLIGVSTLEDAAREIGNLHKSLLQRDELQREVTALRAGLYDAVLPKVVEQRDKLLVALTGLCGLAALRPGHLHEYKQAVADARAIIAEIEATK